MSEFYNKNEVEKLFSSLKKEVDKALCCCENLEGRNLGNGIPIYAGRFRNNFKFKTLLAGTNITLEDDGKSVTITATGGSGSFTCLSLGSCNTDNLPEGSTNLYFSNLRAISALTGQNISLFNNNASYITLGSLSAGTGITYNSLTGLITNASPDQTVVLNNGTSISVVGTYPNFTINNTSPDQVVVLNNGTGISVSGTYPNFTITNSAPDQVVTLNAGLGISISGTYPNFTITSLSSSGTVTSVSAGTGMSFSTITTSGSIDIDITKVPYLSSGFSSGFLKYNGSAWIFDNSTYLTSNQNITLSGDVTGSGSTAINTLIGNNVVTNSKIRQSVGLSIIGRASNSTGNVADITASSPFTLLRLNEAGTSLEFGGGRYPIVFGLVQSVASSTTSYFFLNGIISGVAFASVAARQIPFEAGTFSKLYIRISGSQPVSGSLVFSLFVNSSVTALSVTIAAGSAAGSYSNLINSATVVTGDLVCWEFKNNASSTSATITGGVVFFS